MADIRWRTVTSAVCGDANAVKVLEPGERWGVCACRPAHDTRCPSAALGGDGGHRLGGAGIAGDDPPRGAGGAGDRRMSDRRRVAQPFGARPSLLHPTPSIDSLRRQSMEARQYRTPPDRSPDKKEPTAFERRLPFS